MAQTEIDLGNLTPSAGFGFSGVSLLEMVGFSASILDDINGDGLDDVAFGAPASVVSGSTPSVQIIFGQVEEYELPLIASNSNLANRLTITRSATSGELGFAVRGAGDVNGDGWNDLVIGAPTTTLAGEFIAAGQSFVVFGRASNDPFPTELDVNTLDGTTGLILNGADGDHAGSAVDGAGDVNGDGIDDYLIGAPFNNRAYLLYGQAGVQPSEIDLAQLTSSQGVVLSGVTDDFAGATVRGIGDFNGDGFDDVAIAAPNALVEVPVGNNGDVPASIAFGGRVYVVFGGATLSPQIDLSTLNGTNGFVFTTNGPEASRVGSSIDGAGDFNQDGLADLIVGARNAGTGDRDGAGEAYLIFGSPSGTPAQMTRSDLTGSNGLTILGEIGPLGLNLQGDAAGAAVSGIGDYNQDGADDVMIMAPRGDFADQDNVGRSYVLYGSANNASALDLRTLPADKGFVLNGIEPFDGDGVSFPEQDGVTNRIDGGGDVNGDGVPDIVIGNPTAELLDPVNASSGVGYVVFGTGVPSPPGDNPPPQPNPPGEPSIVPNIAPWVFSFRQYVELDRLDDQRAYQDTTSYSEALYLLSHPGVQAAVAEGDFASGLDHYLRYGLAEERDIVALSAELGGIQLADLFDETYYLGQNPGVAAAVTNGEFTYGYEHFLRLGIQEGRNPSGLYDESFYLASNPGVAAAVANGDFASGLEHYLRFGHIEHRVASELFDPDDYLIHHPGVAAAVSAGDFSSALEHYLEFGIAEGRLPARALFEASYYLDTNPGVGAAIAAGEFASAFEHYVVFGQREGRNPSPLFDEGQYLSDYPGVADAVSIGTFSSGFEHYIRFGRTEERAIAV